MMLFLLSLACTSAQKETAEDLVQENTCNFLDFPADAFALLPASPKTQIHADIAFSGEYLWMTYNLPNDEGKFDVYLASFDCEGNPSWGPSQILQREGVNQTTPRIAISGDHILVASQGDNASAGNNLSIQLHIQDENGNLIQERDWAPSVDGEVIGNHWLPSVVGTDDGFWIAAAAASTNGPYFRTLVQALDADGAAVEPPHWVGPDSYAVYPNIDAQDERYVVSWDDQENVYWTTGTITGQDGETQQQSNAGFSRVIWDGATIRVFSSQISPPQILLDGESLSSSANTHLPNAVSGENSIAYAHFRIQSGFQNDLLYGHIQGDSLVSSDQIITSNPAAAPYRPAITHLGGDSFFVVWSQGDNPDFELWGQRLTLD